MLTSLPLELDHCKRMLARLTTLNHAIERLHASVRPVDVGHVIEDIVLSTIGGARCAVFAFDEDRAHLRLLTATLGDSEIPREIGSDGVVAAAATSGRLFVDNTGELPGAAPWERTLRASVPVKYCDRVTAVIAILGLNPSKKRFTPLDVELFDQLTRHAGVALNTAATIERERNLRN